MISPLMAALSWSVTAAPGWLFSRRPADVTGNTSREHIPGNMPFVLPCAAMEPAHSEPGEGVVSVAVPAPLFQSYDYLPPADRPLEAIRPGMRLRVPFGRQSRIALVLDTAATSTLPRRRLRRATALLDEAPVLPADILALLRWAADYYHHPLGEVIATALPTLLRRGRPAASPSMSRRYRLTAAGQAVDPDGLIRAPRQAALLRRLRQHPEGLAPAALADIAGGKVLRTLVDKGWLEILTGDDARPEGKAPSQAVYRPPHLHPPQAAAVTAIAADLERFQAFLLEGVTGSGKTEVYLRLIEQVVAAGRQALVLVPEIGLTPQLVARFRRHLHSPLAVLHSGLGDRERLEAWLAARDGRAAVVIGTRSAVFTPLARPGLIIIDEEHDPSFKQQDGFRYHARDIAVMRARRSGIPVVLGSATPALESLDNAARGRYRHLRLTSRAGGAAPPRLRLIDSRTQVMDEGLSRPLLSAVAEHLSRDRQVLLFLNRRGYAPTLYCPGCGWIACCPRCDAHLVLHRGQNELRCHHCDSRRDTFSHCPDCAQSLLALGQGTERVEEALARHFPETDIVRIDRDSTRRRHSLEHLLARLREGRRQILLGTQMIAKGHHLPRLTLVGILDADQGLFGADFRATERMAQLILQVAGRAGRADLPGEVLIQTRCPEHPVFAPLLRQDYPALCERLLAERRAAQLPPCGALVLLRAEAVDEEMPRVFLEAVAREARALAPAGVQCLGPAPAPMARRAGRHRVQLLLQARHRAPLHRLLATLVPRLGGLPSARRVRWSVDVDPQEMF